MKRALDKLVYPIAMLTPLSGIDQATTIWTTRSAEGVSVLLWCMFLFTSAFWVLYGSIHEVRAIKLANVLLFLVSAAILVEIVLFS